MVASLYLSVTHMHCHSLSHSSHCDVSLFPLTSFFSLIVSLVLFVSLTDSFSLLLIAYDSFARCLSQSLTRSLPSPHTRYLSHTAQSHALPLSRMTPLTRCVSDSQLVSHSFHPPSLFHSLSLSVSLLFSLRPPLTRSLSHTVTHSFSLSHGTHS